MPEENDDSQKFGIRTTVRVSPLGYKSGEAISTNTRSNAVSLLGNRTDEWSFDGCFDALPPAAAPSWATNEQIFRNLWCWAEQQQKAGREELTCIVMGGPGSGKSFTLFGSGDITDFENPDTGVLTRFLREAYTVGPDTDIQISANLIYGEDIIDLLSPPSRQRACENMCYSDSLGSMLLSSKVMHARCLSDALLIVCMIWRVAATFSVEGLVPMSPCHTVISMKTLNRNTAVCSKIRFVELAWHPSTYVRKQSLPVAVDRFSGRAKHGKAALVLAELAKQSIANAQPNPRKKNKPAFPLKTENSLITYLLQDSVFQSPCCYVIGCVRPIVEHRASNFLFFDLLLKLGQLLPIRNPNPEAFDPSILTRIPSFSSDYIQVRKEDPSSDVVRTENALEGISFLRPSGKLVPLTEKIEQEIKNSNSLSAHCRQLILFDKEVEMDVYEGIIVKKEDINAREEKKKKKAREAAATAAKPTMAPKKKGYKEREREIKAQMERELFNQLVAAEETRKRKKVALMKEVAALFFRRIAYSDYFLLLKKQKFLSEFLRSPEFTVNSTISLSTEALETGLSTPTVLDAANDLLMWLGRRGPMNLSLFRAATEHLMEKSWVPPSPVCRGTTASTKPAPGDVTVEVVPYSDSEDEGQTPAVEQKEVESEGEIQFPPPRFTSFSPPDLIEYTTSVMEPHLRSIAPNNMYCFDKLTFPLPIGHTVVAGISVDSLQWECEDVQQRNDSEVNIRRMLNDASSAARESLVPICLPSGEGIGTNADQNPISVERTASKFSMISDEEDGVNDQIHKIVQKEHLRNEENKKRLYTDSVEVFLAGMKTLGLVDIESLRGEKRCNTGNSSDIQVMSLPRPGVEPLHCIFSRFGQKVKLQVYAGTGIGEAVTVGASSRPGTASSLASNAEDTDGVAATAAQAAQLALVWVNGTPITTVAITECSSSVTGVNIKGKKKTVPVAVVLKDGDIIRIGTTTFFQVIIPEEVLPDVVIAGEDQSFKLEDIQAASRGTTPSLRPPSRTITPGSSSSPEGSGAVTDGRVYCWTDWERAISISYSDEALMPLVREAETQRRHYLHLSVNRELARIAKTVETSALMSMLSFSPTNEEVLEMISDMKPTLKAQICDLLVALNNANFMSHAMNRGVFMSMQITYIPTIGDVDFPDSDRNIDQTSDNTAHRKENAVSIPQSVIPGVLAGRDGRDPGAEGCFNISFSGRLYECRIIAEMVGGSVEGADWSRYKPDGNKAARCHWVWSSSLFLDRYYLMQELYCLFLSECAGDASVLDEALFNNGLANDPFVDPPQDELVGVAFLHLDGLQYLLDVADVLPIFNFNGQRAGSIKIHMRCWIDTMETIPEYISVDRETNIASFVDHKMIIRLYFENLLDIPEFLSSGHYVSFKFFFHGGTYSTARHCGITTNPFLNDPVVIEQTITNDFIEYIKTGSLELEVFGKRIVPNSALEEQRLQRETAQLPPTFNPGVGGPSIRLRSFGISSSTSPYISSTTMLQACGEPFDWRRGGASELEGSAGQSALKNMRQLEDELKHMEDALEESQRKLRHANKLAATLTNDRESVRGELSKLQSDIGPGFDSTLKRLESAELELRRSRKEIERLSKKSRICVIS